MPKADIAIITVIPEEYAAVATRLEREGCAIIHDPGTARQPNRYGWVTCGLADEKGRAYQLVLAAAVSAGPTHMANAVNATLVRFKPRHVLIVGIAGGFPLDGLTRGDVAVSSLIYDYEYGKIADGFQPRHDNTYQVDGTLYRSAVTLHARDSAWATQDEKLRPHGISGCPKLLHGAIASGSKVVDNADYALFASVLAAWPKLLAVEMEGAGAVATINDAVSGGSKIGFLMIRGISDMPKGGANKAVDSATGTGNTLERDTWKKYAAAVAASFTVHWIKRGWPVPPARRTPRSTGTPPAAGGDDDRPPPTNVIKQPNPKAVTFDPFAGVAESRVWLGFVKALSSNPDPEGELARVGTPALRAMIGLLAERSRADTSAGDSLDIELELIKSHLERHEPEVAEAKLKELESRAADRLKPHQWYQLKALRSRVYSGRWEWERAGRELLDAKRHMPETERARVNEALGYELLGERDKAHALATPLRAEFPHSARLLTVWLRTAPPGEPFDGLVAAAAPLARDDEELNLALAYRALSEGRFEEATKFAERATELGSNSPHAWFVLGQATHAFGFKLGTGNPAAHYRKAVGFYDRAVALAQETKHPGLEAAVRVNRGKVRHLLGDSRAESDFQRAVELARRDEDTRASYAGYLLEVGRPADALRELEAEPGERSGDSLFLEAAALFERNAQGDRERGNALLRRFIDAGVSDRWVDAHIVLVKWAVEGKTQAAARGVLAAGGLREKDPLVYHTLDGWLAESEGETEAARSSFRKALDALLPTARRDHIFLLAQALVTVGEDALALPLLERCYRPGVFDDECKKLLGTAKRLERHDVSRRVCQELREAGSTDPRIIETEIGILQMYDPNEALRVAREYLAKDPANRHVALWQSALALRLDRPELVISDTAKLPGVNDLTPQGCGLVVNILAECGLHSAALGFAYDALRAHFESEFAHGSYLAYFLRYHTHCPELRVGGRAERGSAVCYREEHSEVDRWAVIEDGSTPDLGRDEFPPDHPVSLALLGRKVGETVLLSTAGVQPRSVTLRHAFHKFVYRFQDCRDRYQFRFPGGSAIQLVHVGSGDEFDPSPIIESLEGRKKHIERLDQAYRSGPMPFATYTQLAGVDEFQAWGHLASDQDLGIRSGDSDQGALRNALDLVKGSKTLTLDLTSLITLAQLELLHVVQAGMRKLVVSQTTYERLQHLAEQAADGWEGPSSFMLDADGELARDDLPPEQIARRVQLLAGLRDAIRSGCEIRPCPQASSLDPTRRDRMVQVLGRPGLDTLLLATSPDTVLWADDIVLGLLGRTDFQTRRVWSQAVLFVLQQEGCLGQQDYDHAIARLVGWNYQAMILNEETLVAAAEIANWQMDHWPVPTVMRALGNQDADTVMRLRMAALAIRAVWRRDLPSHSRQAFLFAILSGLRSERLVRRLHKAIPSFFSLDFYSEDEVKDCIAVWLRHPSGLILP